MGNGEQIQVRSCFNPQTEYRWQLHRECRPCGEGGGRWRAILNYLDPIFELAPCWHQYTMVTIVVGIVFFFLCVIPHCIFIAFWNPQSWAVWVVVFDFIRFVRTGQVQFQNDKVRNRRSLRDHGSFVWGWAISGEGVDHDLTARQCQNWNSVQITRLLDLNIENTHWVSLIAVVCRLGTGGKVKPGFWRRAQSSGKTISYIGNDSGWEQMRHCQCRLR